MHRALVATVLMLVLPTAYGQDRAKGDFIRSAEFRLRGDWKMDESGSDAIQPKQNNTVSERFKLDLGFRPSEKLFAELTIIHGFNFGSRSADPMNTPDGGTDHGMNAANQPIKAPASRDLLLVNQAYATWMVTEDIKLKLGRQNYSIADGTLMGQNDWMPTPYAFEGLLANYELEFGKFQAFAFKFRDFGFDAARSQASDPERNAYGVNFDLKTMPEMIKSVNVHVIKDRGDAIVDQNVADLTEKDYGRSITRYGLSAGLAFSILDLKVWYEAMTGEYHELAADFKKTSFSARGDMVQAELAARFEGFMNTRFFARYHRDSGNKDQSTRTDYDAYDPYFMNQHGAAGQMDLLSWGNLTFIELGGSMKPLDSTSVGVAYWMFSKTETGTNASRASTFNFAIDDPSRANQDHQASHIGDEIDVWTEHNYGNSLSTVARVGYFMPGSVFTGSLPAAASKRDQNPLQIFIEGRLTF